MVLRAKSALLLVLVASAAGTRAQDRVQTEVDVPALLRSLDEPVFDARAFLTLVEQGRTVVPRLLHILDHDDPDDEAVAQRRHQRVFRAMRMLDPQSAEALVPELAARLARAPGTRVDAMIETLLVLMGRMRDWSGSLDGVEATFDQALLTTQLQQRRTGTHVGKLESLLDLIRAHARIHGLASRDLHGEIDGLDSKDPLVIEFAAECIGRRGAEARTALDALHATMSSPSFPNHVSYRTANQSGGIAGLDFTDSIRDAASTAIARIDSQDPLARRGLALLLHADDPRERVAAAMALGPPVDEDAVDVSVELLAATKDDDPLVAGEAVTAPGRVGRASPLILDRLKELITAGGALGARAKIALQHLEPNRPRKG